LEKLESEYKTFGKTGTAANKSVKDTLAEVGSNLKNAGEKLKNVGTTLSTHVTAPIVAIGTASMAAWKQVDEALDIVTAKTGATGEALESMQNIVKDVATTIPVSFEEAGTAVGEVNTRFGVMGEQLEKLSIKFLKFAQINGVDVNDSIDTVQKTMDAFGLSAEEASAFLDTLNKVGQDTGVNVLNLASSLTTNATALQGMGMNAADAATLLGSLEKTGIDTSVVMTGFAKVQKEALEDGISMQEAFHKALSSSENAIKIFGSKAGPKLYEAFQKGTLSVDMFTGGVHNLDDALGNLDNTFEAVQDPTDNMQIALNELMLVGHDLGEIMQKELAPIIVEITKALKSFKEWFESLDEDTKQMIVRAAAIIAALGPVIVVLGSVVSAIGSIVGGISSLIGLGGKAVAFFAGTSAAASGTAAASTAATTATTGMSAALAGISSIALPAVAALGGVSAAVYQVGKHWDELKTTFQVFGDYMRANINMVINLCKMWALQAKQYFQQAAQNIISATQQGMNDFKERFTNGLSVAKSTVQIFGTSARALINETMSNISSRVSGAMTNVKNSIQAGFNSAVSSISGAMGSIKSSIQTGFNSAVSTVSSSMGSLKNSISSNFSAALSNVSSSMSSIKQSIQDGFNAAVSNAQSYMSGFRNDVSSIWSSIKSNTSSAVQSVKDSITSTFASAMDTAKSKMSALQSSSRSIWDSISSSISSTINSIKQAVSNTVLKFGSVIIPTFSWSGKNDSTSGTTASMKVGSKTVSYASAMMDGVILDNPTIFGMMNNSMLRAGEAGSEVVVGTHSLMSMIRQNMDNTALVAEVGAIKAILANYIPAIADSDVVLDTGKLVGALTPSINRSLGLKMR
jgi:phage-related minor tail protein